MNKPLCQKLGIKAESKIAVIGYNGDYNMLVKSSNTVELFSDFIDVPEKKYDIIHVFTNDIYNLESSMILLKTKIVINGMIWYSWYKKSSRKQRSVNEDVIRNTALALDLVDVKVCSVDMEWSGLKLVTPLKYRV
jgi:hypothetical protein